MTARESVWVATGPSPPARPRLEDDFEAEVAVIGGGIVGITTALLLAEAGRRVALVEAGRLAGGVSGYTTAKVTSQHGLVYDRLRSRFGAEGARTYGEANEAALRWIVDRIAADEIDCDLRRQPAYAYVPAGEPAGEIEAEHAAAAEAGLPASLVGEGPLPYPIERAVRFDDQAEFHVRKYLLALAERLEAAGGRIFEASPAMGLGSDGAPVSVPTPGGAVLAQRAVVATHYPYLDRSLSFARVHAERSYAIACRIDGEVPAGMHISTGSTTRSIRGVPAGDEELLLVGGEGHRVGAHTDTEERYARLERFAREHWTVRSVEYRWSSQDNFTLDGAPYVGRLTPRSDRALMATGFAKWGLTGGTAAARLLADLILDEPNDSAAFFDPWRLTARASAPTFLREQAHIGAHMVGDRVLRPGLRSSEDLAPGEGGIVRHGGHKVAAYRHDDGRLDAVSARCTHLGCQVTWNSAERSWDCPCHGSRFGTDGAVLQGPAVKPLGDRRD
jgi:glycine/D-amino acid oxidase-like deaminating enzyme/nitrite reductase/ring-hydroxylating ferredoxin subunit